MDDPSLSDSNVKVAVRVRPMNRREKELNSRCVVQMEGNQTVLHPAVVNVNKGDPRNQPKVFAFDYCFWSMDESQKDKFEGQDVVFQSLGLSLLNNAFMGYNACIFAYGQTGSGKSYTMMGSSDQPGLIPRLCSSLFSRTEQEEEEGEGESFTVEVSYMEIYNERVRDLLDPKGSRQTLRVREHTVLGPYVDGLSRLAVASYKDIESLMSEGNKSRTVAATNMNEESSRSHAVFNIILTHTLKDLHTGTSGEKVSKLSLVDLAGSERAAKTGAAGERLKEGSNINKSLSTLGLVISALADQGAGKNRNKFVPYRDSVLTWLLKDSLGGNSRTAMVATISPSADNYDETLSTLRYADRAKNIVNHAVVNEDPNARIIRELREEVEKLKEQLTEAESLKAPELKERLEESEKLIQEMTVTWEDKLRKTEAVAQERQRQLERLGISLQSSGIRVVDHRCFLVNLNADPALNELLVYYLKDHTRVGSSDSQDIQLCGMAIQAEHCVMDITDGCSVVLTPHRNARTCVNGSVITSPVQLHHGDRILWGNNHFFRINLPRPKVHLGLEGDQDRPKVLPGPEGDEGGAAMKTCLSAERLEVDHDAFSDVSSERSFSYESAQAEVMMKGMGTNDPLQSVLQTLERQHQEEKRCALERQRQMYEQELQTLRQRLTPDRTAHLEVTGGTSSSPASSPASAGPSPVSNRRMRRWSEDREAMMTRSLRRLREQIVRANLLTQEAGFIAEELNKRTEYVVTLQIPAAKLDANRKRDSVLSEPAVQVRRKAKGKQIWALEKLENRLVDMRELYQEWEEQDDDNPVMRSYFKRADPFFDEQENHSLIGVANVFLFCLCSDVKLQYAVPIINQKGEVSGRLHVEVWRGTERNQEEESGNTEERRRRRADADADADAQEQHMHCVVKILQATGLPRHLSNFVFCQYHFWGQDQSIFIAPEMSTSNSLSTSKDPQCTVVFDSTKELSVPLSEDFVEFLWEGALAVEVFGHKQVNQRRNLALWDLGVIQDKTRSLRERWSEVTRRLELWVQLMELNEAGDFTPVEVVPAKDVGSGGVFQLRQGQSRRVQVEVRSVPDSGTMPLIVTSILSVSIGDVKVQQTPVSKGSDVQWDHSEEMDSYQEVDLDRLRAQWLQTLTQRQEELDQQLQKVVCKPDKSEDDVERESQLLEGRLTLTEERNAVLVPSAGSGIPGAPVERVPVPGMETHIPVLFLDLSADDFQSRLSTPLVGGLDALLSGEDEQDFCDLHVVKHCVHEVKVEASWDSTVHGCPQLTRVGPPDLRVYLTVRVLVQLSHPAHMQLVLRKRICVSVTGRQGFAQSLLKRMSHRSSIPGCGVTFEIVSNIPGDIYGPEDRDMLAKLAANADDDQSADSEAAIEKYLRSILAVENILTLDKLRQEVAVREQLTVRGKTHSVCVSSCNTHQLDLDSKLTDFKGWEDHLDQSMMTPSSRRTLSSSISQTLNPDTVKAVPRLLKSFLPGGGKEEEPTAVNQTLPRILVQSTSVEEDMRKQQQEVPMVDLVAPQTQTSRSVPLPPPIIPENPDPAPSPSTEASSQSLSTGVSTATLSDVYTLSWDLPPLPGNGTDVFDEEEEEEEEEEDQEMTRTKEKTDSPGPGPGPAPGPGPPKPKPNDTPPDQDQTQEPGQTVQLSEPEEEGQDLEEPERTGLEVPRPDSELDSCASEQVDPAEPLQEPLVEPTSVDPSGPDHLEDHHLDHLDLHLDHHLDRLEDHHLDHLDHHLDHLEVTTPDEKMSKVSVHAEGGLSEPTVDLLLHPEDQTTNPSPHPGPVLTDGESVPSAPSKEPPTLNESNGTITLTPSTTDEVQMDPPGPPEVQMDPPEVQMDPPEVQMDPSDPPEVRMDPPGPPPPVSAVQMDPPGPPEVQMDPPGPPDVQMGPPGPTKVQMDPPGPSEVQMDPPGPLPSNPFTIQKVKSSDLKSFQRILGEDQDRSGGPGLGVHLSVPMETLEIISDSEDGSASAAEVVPDWLKDGEFVTVGTNKSGTVRYVGHVDFAEGTWVGVELEVPAGKNDGSVGGKHYFRCNPGYGVLVRPDRVSRGGAKRRRQQHKRRSANLSGSSPNLAALTALAKGEGGGASSGRSRGENRKSWNT